MVAKFVDQTIFHGDSSLGIKSIYNKTPDVFKVEKGKEWNTKESDPYHDIISIISKLNKTSGYEPNFMVLSHETYYSLFRCNKNSTPYIKMIEDAEIFPNGKKDIYKVPNWIIPAGCGLIGNSSRVTVERYVYELESENTKSISDDKGLYSCFYLQKPEDRDENNMWNFNLHTYQGIGIHTDNAFLRLENLTKNP